MARGSKVVAPTMEELIATAEEVNSVLGLEGAVAIKITKKTTEEDIIELLKAVCEGQLYQSDFEVHEGEGEEEGVTFFTEAAEKTIKALGIEIQEGEPPEAEEAAPEPAPKGKAAPAKAAPAAKEKAAPAKKETAPKKEKESRYTRVDAFADAYAAGKGKITVEDLAAKANDLYVNSGGKDNLKESLGFNNIIIKGILALELATIDAKGIFKLN